MAKRKERTWVWGQVHQGDRYDVQIGTDGYDHYPNNFTCGVYIHDKVSDKKFHVTGHGEFCGNFSPIWVKAKGLTLDIPEIRSGTNFRRRTGRDDEAKGWEFVQLTQIERIPKVCLP